MLSEILSLLLGCHQEFLLDNPRRRRSLSLEGQSEMILSMTFGSPFAVLIANLASYLIEEQPF